jgi:hypothetical protein
MPKTIFDKHAKPKRPAPDYLKALILERMHTLKVSNAQMAEATGMSYNTWCHRKLLPTSKWEFGELVKAAAFLGIEPEDFRAAIRYTPC